MVYADLDTILKVIETEGIIYFGLYGDCTVEFDDIDLNTLYSIFNALNK